MGGHSGRPASDPAEGGDDRGDFPPMVPLVGCGGGLDMRMASIAVYGADIIQTPDLLALLTSAGPNLPCLG